MSHDKQQGPPKLDPYSAKWAAHGKQSSIGLRIRHEVYGDEYPAEADPRSFLTSTELRRLARDLDVGRGDTFIDLGCGEGGPALWVSRETGARVVGIDLVAVRIARARERAQELGLADDARFEVGDILATGLPDASVDAAMSVDVLWAVPDPAAAIGEVARILKPGARFVFTNWDRDRSPPGYPPPVGDHRPLLDEAGFAVERYEVQPDAEDKRRALYERLVAAETTLREELGEETTNKVMCEAKSSLGLVDGVDYLVGSRRIFVVAHKSGFSAAC
jgi:ubiquinone/menaquinone biosynthesis C-methylase UbiE